MRKPKRTYLESGGLDSKTIRSVQTELLELIKNEPRLSKGELVRRLGRETANVEKSLQCLCANGSIKPNLNGPGYTIIDSHQNGVKVYKIDDAL
jgi:predicted HTH transcriptional regulator